MTASPLPPGHVRAPASDPTTAREECCKPGALTCRNWRECDRFRPAVPQVDDEPCVCDTGFTCLADEHDKGRCDACERPGIYPLCCGDHQARMCSTCVAANHAVPQVDNELREAPSLLPLLVTGGLARHAVACDGCGSLVLNNPNAMNQHRDWHRALDGD